MVVACGTGDLFRIRACDFDRLSFVKIHFRSMYDFRVGGGSSKGAVHLGVSSFEAKRYKYLWAENARKILRAQSPPVSYLRIIRIENQQSLR